MFNLKIKSSKGPNISCSGKLDGNSSFYELKLQVFQLTDIPINKQKILSGFPPKAIKNSNEAFLKDIGIKNGEVLIVEELSKASEEMSSNLIPPTIVEKKQIPAPVLSKPQKSETAQKIDRFSTPNGILIKHVVPSDNSCLFASIYYLLNDGKLNSNEYPKIRKIVADGISCKPDLYNEAVLEKSNSDYCKWILKDSSWGGAIEISILSDHYNIEIVSIDGKTGNIIRFGEDKKYKKRIVLLYDGIHYDPMNIELFDGSVNYMIPVEATWVLEQAQDVGRETKASHQFTDTEKFLLICGTCSTRLKGEDEAVKHAKVSGHKDFKELGQ